MGVRHYQPGDEAAQAAIYNAAAAALPGFKPATVVEVQRRVRARDFDPRTRLYFEENGQVVGYVSIHANGRISYPWCLPGHETHATPLFQEAIKGLRPRGVRRAFTAYRGDWTSIHEFFLQQGFRQAREMVNFTVGFLDLPTPPSRVGLSLTPVTRSDVPAIFKLIPNLIRSATPAALATHLFENPYFQASELFATRDRNDNSVRAVGLIIAEPTFAEPLAVDPLAPCFRHGAFGTEGLQTKRIKGLYTFITRLERQLPAVAIDLLTQATSRLRDNDDLSCLAAQCPSDVPELLGFYQRYFRRQGSFPVFERDLA